MSNTEASSDIASAHSMAADHSDSVGATDSARPASKNALKKAAKAARFAATKLERRAREKEARKEKKRLRAEKRALGELDTDEEREEEERMRRKRARTNDPARGPFGARIVVDLGFDDKMNDKEIVSLTSQLAYVYAAHRRSEVPFSSVLFTGLSGRTYKRLETLNNAGYKRWPNTEWWEEGYERLWTGDGSEPTSEAREAISEATEGREADTAKKRNKSQDAQVGRTTTTRPSTADQSSVVYLTADSEDELTELIPGETYIIGGIVDHNRYKDLCFDKAAESGIRTARLPIGTYLAALPTRKVLTVNQVFEILVKWVQTRDWEQALYSVMPKRKFQNNAGHGSAAGSMEAEEEGAGAEAEAEAEAGAEAENEEALVPKS